MTERAARLMAAVTLAMLITRYLCTYPVVNSSTPGVGSDRDDAMNLAAGRLIHGHYPYRARTYLGNEITPMPGSVLLAIPFVLVGTSALQNLMWLPLLYLVLCRELASDRAALLFCLTLLGLSPVVVHELVTGGDLLSNAIYVLLFLLMVVRLGLNAAAPTRLKLAAAAFLGLGLSSRANFVLVIPLAFSMLVRHAGIRTAAGCMAVTIATFTIVTLPFYLADPAHFPLANTVRKVPVIPIGSPFDSRHIVPAAMALLAG